MENDQFLNTLFNTGFNKNEFQKIHNKVLVRCIDSSEERGSRATTDDEDLNKRTNIHKIGCENVSLDTIKIVNGEGDPVVIKRGDEENGKKVYLCPACYNDMTPQVQAQKQKLEIEQKVPLYFCCNCDQLITEDKKD